MTKWTQKVESGNLRFVRHQHAQSLQLFELSDESDAIDCGKLCMCCKKEKNEEEELNPHKFGIATPWQFMTNEEKKERVAYLRFRMKIIAQANNFIKQKTTHDNKKHYL